MSDILTKEELKEFAGHPFFHDKIELLEKLKTRTRELLAMYVPMHSINVHSLRHHISLRPVGRPEYPNLIIEVVSDVINDTNCKTMTYFVTAMFADFVIESAYLDKYFDKTMMEKLKDLSGDIISFSNRESDEVYGLGGNGYEQNHIRPV
jgi:hypothetical protein